jgi:hypothetical protein
MFPSTLEGITYKLYKVEEKGETWTSNELKEKYINAKEDNGNI